MTEGSELWRERKFHIGDYPEDLVQCDLDCPGAVADQFAVLVGETEFLTVDLDGVAFHCDAL